MKGKWLKVLGILLVTVVALMAAGVALLNTDRAQNWLMQRVVAGLKEQLGTEVNVGHISISLFKGGLTLSSVEVDDRQGRKMLQMERLTLGLDMDALWHRKVVVTDAQATGLKAFLCKPASPNDSTANFLFLVDALKSKKPQEPVLPETKKKPREPIAFHLENATIAIDSLCFFTDNGRPRKNTGRPNRGAFDPGHLDLCAAMKVKLHQLSESKALNVSISDFHAVDRGSGLLVDSLTLQAEMDKDSIRLKGMDIRLPHTSISLAGGGVALKTPLHYSIPEVTINTQLRDIAQPFGPALKDFTTPLHAECSFSGDADGMQFDNVRVRTSDRKLTVQASGNITNLKDKHQMRVHFNVKRMTALGGVPKRIVNHFRVKKHMMKQLSTLGRIDYTGHFDVLFKKEVFAGRLKTEAGALNVNFTIDGLNKYLYGTARTDSLELGRIMSVNSLGAIACRANFRFDLSKQRTAKMRRQKGGKLPIGGVDAEVFKVRWKLGTLSNIEASIKSDGAEAVGTVVGKGKLANLSCDFSFTDTDQMQKLKVKPRLKLNKKEKK